MIDEDGAHRLRGHPEEVSAAFPVGALQIDQPQVGLVNQRGGLQCMVRLLAFHGPRGEAVKLKFFISYPGCHDLIFVL